MTNPPSSPLSGSGSGSGDEVLAPQCAALLASLPERSGTATATQLRAGHEALTALLVKPGPAMASVSDLELPADASGPALLLRRFEPRPGCSKALLYLHGGGWVTGTTRTYDALCRNLAIATDAQVYSLEYRVSPEARYPAAIEDTVRAFLFLHRQATRFGLNPERIAIGGDSAGGHLAITAARWLKLAQAALPAALALIYPVADKRLDSGSVTRFGEGFYLTKAQMAWFWDQFVGDTPIADDHPDLSPALADDLAGLPPTYVLTAGCDILRDEGEMLARRLGEAAVPVLTERVAGVIHGFIRFDARLDASAGAVSSLAAGLSKLGF